MKKTIVILTLVLMSNCLLSQSSNSLSKLKRTMCYGLMQKPDTNIITLKIKVSNYGKSYFNIAKIHNPEKDKYFGNIKGLVPSTYAIGFNIYDCNTYVSIQDNAICQEIYIDVKTNKLTINNFSISDFIYTIKAGEELIVECIVLEKFPKGFFTRGGGNYDEGYIAYIRRITRYVYQLNGLPIMYPANNEEKQK